MDRSVHGQVRQCFLLVQNYASIASAYIRSLSHSLPRSPPDHLTRQGDYAFFLEADDSAQLLVNGLIVGSSPGRFVVSLPVRPAPVSVPHLPRPLCAVFLTSLRPSPKFC